MCDLSYSRCSGIAPISQADDVNDPIVEQQEIGMEHDMEHDTALLTDSELDFVAGGAGFFDTDAGRAVLGGILDNCGPGGAEILRNSFIKSGS